MMRAARTIFSLCEDVVLASGGRLKTGREVFFDLPGLAYIDHIDAVWTSLPKVWFHVDLKILGAQMALGCQ